ncbi:MAG: hypothetical protein ACR2II_07850 [Chthoniobacterales bacterium]
MKTNLRLVSLFILRTSLAAIASEKMSDANARGLTEYGAAEAKTTLAKRPLLSAKLTASSTGAGTSTSRLAAACRRHFFWLPCPTTSAEPDFDGGQLRGVTIAIT